MRSLALLTALSVLAGCTSFADQCAKLGLEKGTAENWQCVNAKEARAAQAAANMSALSVYYGEIAQPSAIPYGAYRMAPTPQFINCQQQGYFTTCNTW